MGKPFGQGNATVVTQIVAYDHITRNGQRDGLHEYAHSIDGNAPFMMRTRSVEHVGRDLATTARPFGSIRHSGAWRKEWSVS